MNPLPSFLQTAAPVLYSRMSPFKDTALLEAHGEEFLELVINKAPEAEWMEWLFKSLLVAARADNTDVFHRLFALCKDDPDFWEVDRRVGRGYEVVGRGYELVGHTAQGGSAAVLSDLLGVDFLLSTVWEVDERQFTPSALSAAAENGYRGCVAMLIKAGAPIEYKCILGGTALTVAVANGQEGVVIELLAAGADVDSINKSGYSFRPNVTYPNYTPLGMAAAQSYESMVGILLAAGADLGKNRTDSVPIIVAVQAGCCGSLKRLLVAGADVNLVNARGQSALHLACLNSREGVVELLLRHGASLTSRCDQRLSPCDVVAMGVLSVRETWRRLRRGCPGTLDVVETAAADRIHGMLHGASAWGRRGWLIMMRARIVPVQLLDESATEKPSPGEQAGSVDDEEAMEREFNGVCVAVEGLSLPGAPSTGTLRGLGDSEKSAISTTALSPGAGHDSAGQAGHGGGWDCAVEWLLQCPDERGIFREILGFL